MKQRRVTRTELFEEIVERIGDLRRDSLKARTLARAFVELDEAIEAMPSRGDLHDTAKRVIRNYAQACAEQATNLAHANTADADRIERDGVE